VSVKRTYTLHTVV